MPSKRYRLRWSRPARRDLDVILEYIAARSNVDAALGVHDELMTSIESLVRLPERCRIVPELKQKGVLEFHELIIAPYRVCFRVVRSDVVIVAVLDGRRDLDQILFDRALLS